VVNYTIGGDVTDQEQIIDEVDADEQEADRQDIFNDYLNVMQGVALMTDNAAALIDEHKTKMIKMRDLFFKYNSGANVYMHEVVNVYGIDAYKFHDCIIDM
jgi:hypothetical protein